MDNGTFDHPPISYYHLRKRAATWLRCGTLSSLVLTLAGVAMIILGIQGTPASYNIKWIGIAASASGGSLLLLLLLISLIMASFCPDEADTPLQVHRYQGLASCSPTHHHIHARHHAMASGSGSLTPTSRLAGRASLDGMQWMVYYHPSKQHQLEHSIMYPIPGFHHGMTPTVAGPPGGQWAWRAHNTTIQPPPQYSAIYPSLNGECGEEDTTNSTVIANNSANTDADQMQGEANVGTPTNTAVTTPTEQHRTLQRPQRLTPPPLLRGSPPSDGHLYRHHHHSFHRISGHGVTPPGQRSRTPTPGQQQQQLLQHRVGPAGSPGQISNIQHPEGMRASSEQLQQRISPLGNNVSDAPYPHHQHHPHRDYHPPGKTPSPSQSQSSQGPHFHHHHHSGQTPPSSSINIDDHAHLFHHDYQPQAGPVNYTPPVGSYPQPSSSSSSSSSVRRSYHSSLPASPLLDDVDETHETSDCV